MLSSRDIKVGDKVMLTAGCGYWLKAGSKAIVMSVGKDAFRVQDLSEDRYEEGLWFIEKFYCKLCVENLENE